MEWTKHADAVFRGGGVKGLGLAGALEGFAEHKTYPVTTWVNAAGASAGAIIASFIAVKRGPNVGNRMIQILDPERLASFQDFPFHQKYLGGIPRLLLKHGMAPGNAFEAWFDDVLGGATFTAASTGGDWTTSRLKLIACDVTNRRLLVLPEDLVLYREPGTRQPIDPANFKIARAARMSMSIPYFFQPVELESVSTGRLSSIVDGGTLSNFPVWLFDVAEPQRPTFGFTLKGGSGVGAGMNKLVRVLPWVARFAFDIFHTAEEAWDDRFMTHSTKVRTLAVDATVRIPGQAPYPVNTTDFKLSEGRQAALIRNGRVAAKEFLDGFDMQNYVNTLHAQLPVTPAPAPALAAEKETTT